MRLLAILVLGLAIVPAVVGGTGKSDKRIEAYALVSGSVFRDTGMALPGAEIVLLPTPEPGKRTKLKKLETVSDSRGEFAFRVPAGQANYILTVRAKGYQAQQKPVATTGEDRIDVFFRLDPASK